jgi:glycosyltransferase involved in cell wall biosynthesis
LQQLVREIEPVILHTWGPSAASAARLVVSDRGDGCNIPKLVISGAEFTGGGVGGWLLARRVRRADRVIPTTRVEGERYRQLGVPSERLTRIGPAAPQFSQQPNRDEFCKGLGIPSTAQLLVAGGRSERGIGPKDAIIAFDMLRYNHPQLRLIVYDTGTEAEALEYFGRALAFDDFRIHFAACHRGRAAAAQLAVAALITHARGGVYEALEAMAAGKPVVGWRTPELEEVVDDGVTGFLVPVGDRSALASKMQILLEVQGLAAQMGEAGRARAAGHFNINRMIEHYAQLYTELAGN